MPFLFYDAILDKAHNVTLQRMVIQEVITELQHFCCFPNWV